MKLSMETMKLSMKIFPSIFDTDILGYSVDAISSISMEIMLFVVAMASYIVLARIRLQAKCRSREKQKIGECDEDYQTSSECREPESCYGIAERFRSEEESTVEACKEIASDSTEINEASQLQTDSYLQQRPPITIATPLELVVQSSKDNPGWCNNMIVVSGHRSKVKAACRTFKKHGFLKSCGHTGLPFDGHWETDHGLNVIIEGKLVRWTQQRASRLKFIKVDKRSCQLMLYGEPVEGHLVTSSSPGVAKMLRWGNGDVWHSYESRRIDKEEVFRQTMTKVLHDDAEDELVRARVHGRLKAASKDGLGLLPYAIDHILRYVGSDRYYFNVCFDTRSGCPWSGRAKDFLGMVSRQHPHIQIHHCWSDGVDESGQRKVVKGCDVALS